MKSFKLLMIVMALTIGSSLIVPASTTETFAQATCRNKCNDKDQACLKRTNNKGQCGKRAKTCHSKCR